MFEVTVQAGFSSGHYLRNYHVQVRKPARPQLPCAGHAGR